MSVSASPLSALGATSGAVYVSAIVAILVLLLVLLTLARTVRIVPQARAGIVERLGRYHRTLNPGLSILVPFIDNLKPLIDMREQVVSFPPQPVITEDNLVVEHRLGHLLPGHRPEGRDVRDRQLHPGDRAAHRHDAAQRRRWDGPRRGPDLPRHDQCRAARRARRGHGQVGRPRQPRRDQGDRPAAVGAGVDGEADARRAGEARDDPHGRGLQAEPDPHRRGRAAVRHPPRRG